MKKIPYFIAFILTLLTSKSNAQYHITSHNWHNVPKNGVEDPTLLANYGLAATDTFWFCNSPELILTTNAFDTGLTIKTYYGDGTSYILPLADSGTFGYADFYCYIYNTPGVYSIKQVLCLHGIPIDSVSGSFEHYGCGAIANMPYYDISAAGHFVLGTDILLNIPVQFEVDSNGIVIDTVTSSGAVVYNNNNWANTMAGTIYGFRELTTSGLITTTPSSGINYDTTLTSGQHFVNYTGNNCGASGFDLAVYAASVSYHYHAQMLIIVDNLSCFAQDETVTMHFSPKYNFASAIPAPLSVVGNAVTWFFPAGTLYSPHNINVSFGSASGTSIPTGDTLHYYVTVTPTSGDANLINNYMVIVDTCRSATDPNEMLVSPVGTITAGTQLQYTIGFENTGNDTAFNISVYDTLSDNVDVKSLKFVAATNYVTTSVTHLNGQNILKFDFPHINLLDSSHHNLCDGMVVFTINTKTGLPNGTTIFNGAGIYFDDNPVVMTNNVENIIGLPTTKADLVPSLSKVSVYPNPANNEVTISADNTQFSAATFTNVLGQLVLAPTLNVQSTKVNISSLPAGIYYITLSGEGGVKVMEFEKL